MIIDTSVLVCILKNEPDKDYYLQIMMNTEETLYISASTKMDALIVMQAYDPINGKANLNDLLAELSLLVMEFTDAQAVIAGDAFPKYGKGMGNKAGLNMGDLASYALAKDMNKPLLFKGSDFIEPPAGNPRPLGVARKAGPF